MGLQCCSDQDQLGDNFLYINISVKLAYKLRSTADVRRLQIDSFLQTNTATDPVQICYRSVHHLQPEILADDQDP